MRNNSKFSRRSFLSGMAAVGAGTALSGVRVPAVNQLEETFALNNNEVIENSNNPVLLKRLIPRPKNINLNDDREVIFDENLSLNIELKKSDRQVELRMSNIFKQYFNVLPNIKINQKSNTPSGEAYKIKASGSTLTLSATDLTGIRYALNTLRQLAEVHSGTGEQAYYSIPETEIEDEPAMAFRGLHLCWFPETRVIQIERYIRWAAYYKFNHIIIEFWATFPFSSHPAFCWEGYAAMPGDIKRLVKIGKELGVTLIPQLNIFGHASGSRGGSGKHAPLDYHPEYQSLFEPDGWVWCLSNPATREVLTDMVLETFEAFDNPSYYHIGGDEAGGAAECRLCRHSDYRELLIGHLKYFHKLLAERNCRMMMWHDMLIQSSDSRWKGYVSNGSPRMKGVLEELPKDIIICDWQYGEPKENETWPTMPYFKKQGFEVLACPWNKASNIRSLGENVNKASLDGLLCTTWHSPHYNQMLTIMMAGADAAWATPPYAQGNGTMSMRHLRQIGWDIPVREYTDTGIHELQVRPEIYP